MNKETIFIAVTISLLVILTPIGLFALDPCKGVENCFWGGFSEVDDLILGECGYGNTKYRLPLEKVGYFFEWQRKNVGGVIQNGVEYRCQRTATYRQFCGTGDAGMRFAIEAAKNTLSQGGGNPCQIVKIDQSGMVLKVIKPR